MVMHIHRIHLTMVIPSWLTRQVKDEESMALIFLFSSTFFILVNYCFGVYVVYHFYCSGFLYRDLGMVQFYKAISYSAKMQYLNHCPWEISFQMQLFEATTPMLLEQQEMQYFKCVFSISSQGTKGPCCSNGLSIIFVCNMLAQVNEGYLLSRPHTETNGPDLKLTSLTVVPSIKNISAKPHHFYVI